MINDRIEIQIYLQTIFSIGNKQLIKVLSNQIEKKKTMTINDILTKEEITKYKLYELNHTHIYKKPYTLS